MWVAAALCIPDCWGLLAETTLAVSGTPQPRAMCMFDHGVAVCWQAATCLCAVVGQLVVQGIVWVALGGATPTKSWSVGGAPVAVLCWLFVCARMRV